MSVRLEPQLRFGGVLRYQEMPLQRVEVFIAACGELKCIGICGLCARAGKVRSFCLRQPEFCISVKFACSQKKPFSVSVCLRGCDTFCPRNVFCRDGYILPDVTGILFAGPFRVEAFFFRDFGIIRFPDTSSESDALFFQHSVFRHKCHGDLLKSFRGLFHGHDILITFLLGDSGVADAVDSIGITGGKIIALCRAVLRHTSGDASPAFPCPLNGTGADTVCDVIAASADAACEISAGYITERVTATDGCRTFSGDAAKIVPCIGLYRPVSLPVVDKAKLLEACDAACTILFCGDRTIIYTVNNDAVDCGAECNAGGICQVEIKLGILLIFHIHGSGDPPGVEIAGYASAIDAAGDYTVCVLRCLDGRNITDIFFVSHERFKIPAD